MKKEKLWQPWNYTAFSTEFSFLEQMVGDNERFYANATNILCCPKDTDLT